MNFHFIIVLVAPTERSKQWKNNQQGGRVGNYLWAISQIAWVELGEKTGNNYVLGIQTWDFWAYYVCSYLQDEVRYRNEEDKVAIHYAASDGDLNALKLIFLADRTLVDVRDGTK